jgi:hypothetical protein
MKPRGGMSFEEGFPFILGLLILGRTAGPSTEPRLGEFAEGAKVSNRFSCARATAEGIGYRASTVIVRLAWSEARTGCFETAEASPLSG